MYTDKIYKSIFKEDADEYRKILKLHVKENIRDTMYAEVLNLISSYEYAFLMQKWLPSHELKLGLQAGRFLLDSLERLCYTNFLSL